MNDGVTFELAQERILRNLQIFGDSCSGILLHHNDCVRVYRIVMSITNIRDMFQRLAAGGFKNRSLIDNPIHVPLERKRKEYAIVI